MHSDKFWGSCVRMTVFLSSLFSHAKLITNLYVKLEPWYLKNNNTPKFCEVTIRYSPVYVHLYPTLQVEFSLLWKLPHPFEKTSAEVPLYTNFGVVVLPRFQVKFDRIKSVSVCAAAWVPPQKRRRAEAMGTSIPRYPASGSYPC